MAEFFVKRLEVVGATKEEAFANAPFGIKDNATQAFKNWKEKQHGAITSADEKNWMVEYLKKKTKGIPGVGCYIVLESAVPDKRKRPYEIISIKNEQGARKTGKVYQLIDDDTHQVLAQTDAKEVPQVDKEGNKILDKDGNVRMKVSSETITKAKELGRKLYENGYKGNLTGIVTKQVIAGQQEVFKMRYTPSAKTKAGRYLIFGVENS